MTNDPLLEMLIERMHTVGIDMAALGFGLRSVQVKEGADDEDNRRRMTVEMEFRR